MRVIRPAIAIGALALALAGCGGAATNASKASGDSAEGAVEELSVFYSAAQPNLSDINLLVAQDEGIFKKYGLDVEITNTEGVAPTFQAVVAGRADVGFVDAGQVYAAANQGQEMKVVVDTSPRSLYFLITSPKIKDWSDLATARVGVSQPGTLSERIVQLAMQEEGVSTDKVEWLAVGGSGNRLRAVESDRVDAGVGFAAHALEAETKGGNLKNFSNLAEVLPNLQGYTWASSESTVDERRDALVKFSAAMIEATRLVAEDEDLAVDTYVKYQKTATPEEAHSEYQMIKDVAWGVDGGMAKEPFEYTTKTLVDAGEIKSVPAFEDIMATDIRDEAVALVEGK